MFLSFFSFTILFIFGLLNNCEGLGFGDGWGGGMGGMGGYGGYGSYGGGYGAPMMMKKVMSMFLLNFKN